MLSDVDRREVAAMIQASVSGAYALAGGIKTALMNHAFVEGNPVVHVPGQATITPFAGIKLTARASGLFQVAMSVQAAAAAADVVTWTVSAYTDAVVGPPVVPLTLPANAVVVGTAGAYADNSGAGIAPAGATAAAVILADQHTIGTAAANDLFEWSGIVGAGGIGAIPVGQTFYLTLSVTNSVAARALSQLTLSAFELPA